MIPTTQCKVGILIKPGIRQGINQSELDMYIYFLYPDLQLLRVLIQIIIVEITNNI